jgi:hypothetical protein
VANADDTLIVSSTSIAAAATRAFISETSKYAYADMHTP